MGAVANVPGLSAAAWARLHGLAVSPLPFDTPRFELALVRHAREGTDQPLSFVCDHLRAVVRAQSGQTAN